MCYAYRALTPTEDNCSQVEKELPAVVFSCEKFDQYVYGRHNCQIRPKIARDYHKEIADRCTEETTECCYAFRNITLMCTLEVKKCTLLMRGIHTGIYLAYCHTHDTGDNVLAVELEEMDLTEDVDMSANGLQEILDKSLEDDEIKAAVRYTLQGWPDHRQAVDPIARPFFQLSR